MSAYLLLSPPGAEDEIEPHPELVRAQRPTVTQVMQAAVTIGVLPPASYLRGEARISLRRF